MYEYRDVSVLLGETLVELTKFEDTALHFTTASGKKYIMYHQEQCCEGVWIESIVGDLSDLTGEPLLIAEAVSSDGVPPIEPVWGDNAYLWTFYKFATRKGYVDIRWYGTSNGYYSVGVDFVQVE